MATEFRPIHLIIFFLSFMISTTLFDVSGGEESGPAVAFHALDPNDPVVFSIGRFAVEENNKQKNENIKFEKVLEVADQEIGGGKTEYGLLIKAVENDASNTYAAVVLDGKNSGKELVGFKKQVLAV